jgi:hypothetical protein
MIFVALAGVRGGAAGQRGAIETGCMKFFTTYSPLR